ncbi:MAG TPA: hypothetical protein P5087_02465 [Eubacteriales bacterium]|nr:hypothetical protein [Eubacteriales bacterium]
MKNDEIQYKRSKCFKILLISLLIVSLLSIFSSCSIERENKIPDELKGYTVTVNEHISLPFNSWSLAISSVPGLPIEFDYDDTNTVVEITADDGEFLILNNSKIEYLGKNCQLVNPQNIYWTNLEDVELFTGQDTYVGIIVYENGNIIGYAVINIYLDSESDISFKAKFIESYSFEKINGEYQNIDKDLILQLIEEAKESAN